VQSRQVEEVAKGVSYSVRLSRRTTERPAASIRFRSAATSDVSSSFTKASVAVFSGRDLTLFGGISPDFTRSCTLTHVANASAGSFARSSPPFFCVESWHDTQWESRNARGCAAPVEAAHSAAIAAIGNRLIQ
jgi:hypothetical protein